MNSLLGFAALFIVALFVALAIIVSYSAIRKWVEHRRFLAEIDRSDNF